MDLSDIMVRVVNKLRQRAGLSMESDRFGMDAAEVPASERKETELHELFYGNDGPLVHKWRHYLAIYDRHLSRFRGRSPRLLELGVSQGGSLVLWRRYFGPDATIFGVDIEPRCAAFNGQHAQVRIGSQADPAFLAGVVAEMGGLDIVIDDGNHVNSYQRISLDVLFPQLSAEGVYICEDLHTSYWRGTYEGGYRRRSSFIETAKRIVDDMHADFHGHGEGVPGASRSVHGIHFYNSMVVIEKKPQHRPAHIRVGTNQF